MSDEAALLKAIIAHPDEDTPRLVYADWLDEHGDPDRAEFIRVQCWLADMPPSDPEWVDLCERQDELAARLKHRLWDLCPDDPDGFSLDHDFLDAHEEPFRRGFPYFIACQTSDAEWTAKEVTRVTAELARLVRTTTLRGFEPYSTPPERLTELLAAPVVAELTGLALAPEPASNDEEAELAALYRGLVKNPNLRRVKQLYLYRGTPPAAVVELARAKTFDAVERLTIQNLVGRKTDLDRLTQAAWFRRVRHFRSHLSDSAVAVPVLTGLGRLPHLHTLDLPDFTAESSATGRLAALKALAAGKFPALARLLYGGPLAASAATLLAGARFPALVAFEVPHGWAKDYWAKNEGLAALLKADWFARLRVLDLSENAIGDKGLKALAAHPVAKNLRVLKLADNAFGKAGLAALTAPGAFPELTTLDLGSYHKRKGTPAEMAAFLSGLRLPRLRHLDLMGWPLGDAGATALAQNPALAGLTRLTLDDCGISDPGAKALFASPHLQNLVELHFDSNRIKTGADALADPAVMPRLGECHLGGNKISEKAAEKLQRDGLYLMT